MIYTILYSSLFPFPVSSFNCYPFNGIYFAQCTECVSHALWRRLVEVQSYAHTKRKKAQRIHSPLTP